jgi:hypothetical protein
MLRIRPLLRRAGRTVLFAVAVVFVVTPLVVRAAPLGPRPPSNLVASAVSESQIYLTWTDNSGIELGYKVYRSVSATGPWERIATVGANSTSYLDTNLTSNSTYYYQVRAFNQSGNSAYSNTASATTLGAATLPATPSNLVAVAISSSAVRLSWVDHSDNESGFRVDAAPSPTGPWSPAVYTTANATNGTHTGLTPATTYYYRARATNSAGDSPSSNTTVARTLDFTGSTVASPRGIYMLDANTGLYRLGLLARANLPYVDGYAWRMPWTAFDTGTTTGVYNFIAIDTAISQLQSLSNNQNNRMKLSLVLNIQQPPAYVLSKAAETFQAQLPGNNGTATVPVPWDANALAEYAKFTKALGDHLVYDAVSRTYIPLRDHPALGQINAGIIGLQAIRDLGGNCTAHPSYTRSKFVQAIRANVHALQDQFPAKPTYLAYFSMQDSTRNPSLDEDLIAALNAEFDGSTTARPHIGLFQEALRGDNPIPGGNGLANNLVAGHEGGCFILFQACGSWLNRTFCTWSATDTTPANGFTLGYGTYGALYYELYEADISYSGYTSTLQQWHDFLQTAP